jgi:hypothetical protein
LLLLTGIMRRASDRRVHKLLCLVAISPASILISGFHGNTDPIMMAFVLASIFLIESQRAPWTAGISLGMALNIKLAALLFVPAMLLYVSGTRRKLVVAAGAAATFLAGSMPYLVQEPHLILTRVTGYKSAWGWWGIGRLCEILAREGGLRFACEGYSTYGRQVVMLLIICAAVWTGTRKNGRPLLPQAGLAAFIFLALTPGFGVQYLAWLIPFTILLSPWRAVVYHLVSGAFLFAYYYRDAQAWPSYLVNSFDYSTWSGHVIYLGVLCWIMICANVIAMARQRSLNFDAPNPVPGNARLNHSPGMTRR